MKRPLFLFAVLLTACPGPDKPPGGDGGGDGAAGDWCGVQEVFEAKCVSCHSAATPSGGLDLETDPIGAMVGVESETFPGNVLIVAGDPEASFLYAKVTDTQGLEGGEAMPPPDGLPADEADLVREWIAAGATDDCEGDGGGGGDTGDGERYHAEGYAAPDVHGLDAKLQVEDCTSCHGADLAGGTSGVSCDTCHDSDWRTSCTFCHGGTENATGAPPRDIDGSETEITFSPHTTHVTETIKPAYDCVQCHAKPTDALSPGHLFVGDDTPGVAEVDFSGGISPTATWDGAGCSNLYCHGNGQTPDGAIQASDPAPACGECHGVASNGGEGLSGEHGRHVGRYGCADCHGGVAGDGDTIADPTRHVDGNKDFVVTEPITFDPGSGTCTGTCHGEGHSGRNWW